jgi:hypothetical protein
MPPPTSFSLMGQVTSVLGSREAIGDVTVTGTGLAQARTDAAGLFTLRADTAATYSIGLTKPEFVQRTTKARIPGDVAISMISSAFDLVAFEEFAPRASGLNKWITNPTLLILKNPVDFLGAQANFTDFRVTDREVAPSGIDCVTAYMRAAITEMTGGRLSFTRTEIITAASGSRFRTDQTPVDSMVTLFARDLGSNGRGVAYVGQEPWVFNRGVVFLHADSLPLCSSTAERVVPHELGHALGYAPNHVAKQPSLMGSPPFFPLTQFDRDSIAVINQRPPGNRAPDADPDSFSINVSSRLQTGAQEPIP